MVDGSRQAVLLLNQAFEPTSFCSARRAIALVVKDKAVIMHTTEREVRPGMLYPSVIRLKDYIRIPYKTQTLSRKNILLRDRNVCQYCWKKFQAGDLTLDHVMPESRGGPASWANLVASCGPCNRKKADRTPEEAGMTLLHKPRAATIHTSRYILRATGIEHPQWKQYLYHESDDRFVTRHH